LLPLGDSTALKRVLTPVAGTSPAVELADSASAAAISSSTEPSNPSCIEYGTRGGVAKDVEGRVDGITVSNDRAEARYGLDEDTRVKNVPLASYAETPGPGDR